MCKNLNIKVQIFHSSSIFSAAIGESCLDIYKFGPTTTITNWSKNYTPTSFLDVIEKNLKNNQHTLVLFDIIKDQERTLSFEEAIKIIQKAEEKTKKNLLENRKIILLSNIGSKNSRILYSEINKISNKIEETSKNCIIIPSETTFAEKELLELFNS